MKNWKESFNEKFPEYKKYKEDEGDDYNGEVEEFIGQLLEEQKEEILKEVIKISDKIEMEAGHTEFNEWRAFKCFRNTLMDKLNNKTKELNFWDTNVKKLEDIKD